MFLVVNIVGIGRKSGKTRVIQQLVREFTKKNYKVSTIKHISKGSFDTPYKDTWKHLNAGATPVMGLGSNELVTINKKAHLSIQDALNEIPNTVQIVLIEGFKESDNPKIIVARNLQEVDILMKEVSKIIAITGHIASSKRDLQIYHEKPLLRTNKLVLLLEQMIFDHNIQLLPQINCKKCGYKSCNSLAEAILKGEAVINNCTFLFLNKVSLNVDGENVLLSEFPKNFIRHTILGIITSLKGVNNPSKISLEIETS